MKRGPCLTRCWQPVAFRRSCLTGDHAVHSSRCRLGGRRHARPRLIEAGHTPEQSEALLARVPAWRSAPADAVTALAALWTLFRLYKARFGPVEGRDFRARAAEAGRAWVLYRSL
ncbi:hypothetical protein ABT061_13180 [Streptosporangium sp. NPDC002544]|uniref:hypothetical protein n=1 Tax=Streptosporangium sp. NPDC002544 TaxID=3154538 RepID=UPI00333441F5